ncbi:uncharacterized protein [Penaeus vannamei]|uniref:uncharacterized protein n=1 Tax=Penaeus vannamei TaxID=6689 RepID=UPI00387F82DA
MTRWAHELTIYDFELLYKPGRVHHVPDLLSRQIAAIADLDSPCCNQTWWSVIRETNSNFGTESNNERALLQLVIPRSLRGAALDAVHAVPSTGHRGVHRTYQRLRDPFYFPGMLAAFRRYVASCMACQ